MDPPGGSIQSQPHQSSAGHIGSANQQPLTGLWSDPGLRWIHPGASGLIHRGTGLIHHRWIIRR
eukprot:6585176-Prymnesium_polylepis.1